jgi:selenocysteine lyase/cysteine desulfurase
MVHAPAAPLAPLEEALAAFRQQYPTFDTTHVLDELRVTDYARLDTHQQVYLDYTGGGLYAERQLREYVELLSDNVFGNPHSTNPASQAMTVLVDRARRAVLDFFKASPEEYVAIFTPNATGAGFYLTPGEAGFEDGTINYLLLPAVEIGLRYLASIGVDLIHERVSCLTGWVLEQLLALRHSNGQPVVRVYGPINTQRRGGTIAFNFYDPTGALLDCYALQEEANQCGLSVRSGCFCNPGVREMALGFVRENLAASFRKKERMTYEQFLEVIDDQKQGALRVSLGLATTFSDVYRFLQFAQTFINRSASSAGDETAQMDERRHGDTTVISPLGKKRFVARVCACGYQDKRLDKRFCPSCGRPLPTVQSTLSERQPEASQAGKGREQKESRQ